MIDDDSQVAVIQRSIKVFEGAADILLTHQTRAAKALSIAQSIQDQWKTSFAIEDPDKRMKALGAADERSMKFLSRCTETSDEMRDARKAITQLMDMLKTLYTTEENSLDPKKGPLPMAIQQQRNAYAKEVIIEQERQKKIAEAKAAKEQEANRLRSFISTTITQKLLDYLATKKVQLTNSFNSMTLEDMEERSEGLRKLNVMFPETKVGQIISYEMPVCYRLDDIEKGTLQIKSHNDYDFKTFYVQYANEIDELKRSLVDRLGSKKSELLEAKRVAEEAEAARIKEEARQKSEKIKREKEMAKANAEKKAQLEEEARLAEIRNKEKLAEMERQAEEDRKTAERVRLQREENDRLRLQQEADDNRIKAEQDAELKRASEDAMTLFQQTADVAGSAAGGPEVRQSIEIAVVHMTGWVELFQFWFQRAGAKMSLEDAEKMTFEKLKKFAEKAAKDTATVKGERIESKFLKYDNAVSAVNRKAK